MVAALLIVTPLIIQYSGAGVTTPAIDNGITSCLGADNSDGTPVCIYNLLDVTFPKF